MKSSHEEQSRYFFVLAESELERVPDELHREKCVVAYSISKGKRPANMILDASHHHTAMKNLPEGERRGRPDIAHFFLLLCLDSRLNRDRLLTTIVHTRNYERISVSPETRLPPTYHRFIGLFEQLFQNGAVPSKEEPLVTIEEGWKLVDLLKKTKCERILVLDSDAEERNPIETLSEHPEMPTAVVIGGFPSGTFHTDFSNLEVERISLGKEALTAPTVTAEMLAAGYMASKAPLVSRPSG